MKAWRRSFYDMACGAELGCIIRAREPYLELSGDGWRKVRCAQHAGEIVPNAIADDPQPLPAKPLGMASAKQLAATVRMGPKLLLRPDHKKAQSNDDD